MPILRWLPRLFAGIGLMVLAISLWLYAREQAFVSHASHAHGRVVEVRYSRSSNSGGAYYPTIAFTDVRGDSFVVVSHIGSNPPSYRPGEAVDVLYDPANPRDARISSYFQLHFGSFFTSIFALVFGGVGGIWLFVQGRAAALAAELRISGQRIQARVVEIERRTNIRVGMTHPYRIVAQGEDSGGRVVVYRSANIWFDPTQYVGETVGVFVDRSDPRRHLVDLDFLPKLRA